MQSHASHQPAENLVFVPPKILTPVSDSAEQEPFIGPIEKGIKPASLGSPSHEEALDLSQLPKFICFRAALLREKLTLQLVLALVVGGSTVLTGSLLWQLSRVHIKLREKEYILAPGIQDFTTVAPQSVPDSHIQNAAMEFLQLFGTFTPLSIDEQYARLTENMSPEFKVQFELEVTPWRTQVKEEGVSQISSVTEKEIRSDHQGYYHVTAITKRASYVNHEHIGESDQVIEMVLKLVPPRAGKRWFLQIERLTTQEANAFRVKSSLSRPKKASSSE